MVGNATRRDEVRWDSSDDDDDERTNTRVSEGGLRTRGGGENGPALLLVELVAHRLAQSLEFAFRLCTVNVDHEVLEVP